MTTQQPDVCRRHEAVIEFRRARAYREMLTLSCGHSAQKNRRETAVGTITTMDVVDEECQLVLAFLAELDREGYYPTVGELHAFANKPNRRSSTWLRELAMGVSFGLRVEHVVSYLLEVAWIEGREGRVYLTDVGRAVERSVARRQRDGGEALDVVLDPDDPIVLGRVIKQISLFGPCMLVDPYFRLDHLMTLHQYTDVNRVLTSEKTSKADRDGLATGMKHLSAGRRFEIRVAGRELHDRHVVGDTGRVMFLGASLNGIGTVTSVIGEMQDGAAAVAALYNEMWSHATVLGVLEEATATSGEVVEASDSTEG